MSLGLALGIFFGMTPFMGFHTAIAVMLASFLSAFGLSAQADFKCICHSRSFLSKGVQILLS